MFKELLNAWDLEQYISSFEDEGIDDNSFKLLDEPTIDKIFVKSGPKLIFKQRFKEYLTPARKILKGLENIDIDENIEEPVPSGSSINDGSSVSGSISYIDVVDAPETPNEVYEFEFLDNLRDNSSSTLLNCSSSSKRSLDIHQDENQTIKKSKNSNSFPQGLIGLLNANKTDGHIILANKLKLNNDHRQKLCKVVISELIKSQGTEIRGSTFLKISEEITDIFPNENIETYYVPYIPGGKYNKGIGPRGKLWSRYVNVKAALRLANSQKKISEPAKRNSPTTDIETSSLAFLKVGTEPFTKVLEAWENTLKLRKKLYLNSSLSEILTEFPCLKLNSGIELIETDYNQRFSDKIDVIYSQWPKVCAGIIKEGEERSIHQDHSIADKTIKAVLLLPYLFSPVTLKKSRKGVCWRPTRSEIQESFVFYVRNFDELEARKETRRKKLQEYNVTFQPVGVIVGNPESIEPLEFYILVDEIIYKVDTPVRLLELLYKVFHSLDIEYPLESEHIWMFIQEMVFLTKSNKKCPSTSALMADIKYHINLECD